MPREPVATVVVVSRDRWSLAVPTLEHLLSRTDPRHPMVLVESGAPRHVAAQLGRFEATGRLRIAHRRHVLCSNEARNVGADGATTEWIAFVENDTLLSEGWLERLIEFGEARDAASVFPAYLTGSPAGPIIHGVGADVEVAGPDGKQGLREIHHDIGRLWLKVAREIEPVERVQSEPHALLIRRSMLEQMGGLDPGLWSWFDHIDLGLHHRRLGASSWLMPDVTCTYLEPPPVSFSDLPFFLMRWGRDWYDRSLDHLCATWGLDRHDSEWEEHERYRTAVRRRSLAPLGRVAPAFDRAAEPVGRLVVRGNDRARRANGAPGPKAVAHAG